VSELGFEMGDSGESKNESAGTGNSALQHAAAKIVPTTLFFIFKFVRFFSFLLMLSVLHLVLTLGIATSTTGLEFHDRGKERFPCIIVVMLLLASHIRSSLLMMWQLKMPHI
jgi:hypothetical protein